MQKSADLTMTTCRAGSTKGEQAGPLAKLSQAEHDQRHDA
jgi:hypothetical protein